MRERGRESKRGRCGRVRGGGEREEDDCAEERERERKTEKKS